jgi:hypothetical protein
MILFQRTLVRLLSELFTPTTRLSLASIGKKVRNASLVIAAHSTTAKRRGES